MRPINYTQIVLGGLVLGFGFLLYLLTRPPAQTYFLAHLNITPTLYRSMPPLVRLLTGNVPAFLHVFAFILITGGLLGCRQPGALIISTGWLLTDVAFEVGQQFPAWTDAFIPRWFDTLPILENTRPFFRYGTFDPFDLVAICIGAVAAYGFLLNTMQRRTDDVCGLA